MTQRVRACQQLVAALAFSAVFSAVGPVVAADPEPTPIEAARQSVANLDWKQAIRLYAPIRDGAAVGTPEWTEATYCLAAAHHQVQPPDKGSIGKADELYASVVESAKDPRYVARALMSRGRIRELQDFGGDAIDLDGARAFYEQVMTEYAGQPIASEAALRAGATLVMAFDEPEFKKVKQGIALMEKWVATHPNDPLATVIWQYLGDSYFKPLGDHANALRCYEEVDKLGWVDQGNQGVWYWRCAQMAERFLNNRDAAVKYYTKIVTETPNSGKGYESLQALKRLKAPVPHAPLLDDPAKRLGGTPSADASAAPTTSPTTAPTTQEARR